MSSDSEKIVNSLYSESDTDECNENTISEKVTEMVKIEEEVWTVYKYLQKEVDNNGGNLLKNLSLSLVYELMYPNYQPLF